MTVTVSAPRFEHHREALGIGEPRPRLSWVVESAPSGWEQTAYRVEVHRDGSARSFDLSSPDQVLVAWPDDALRSREQVRVRISVRGRDGAWSVPGEWATAEAGLLHPLDWQPAGGPDLERESPDRHAPPCTGATRVRGAERPRPRASVRERARSLPGRDQRRPRGR